MENDSPATDPSNVVKFAPADKPAQKRDPRKVFVGMVLEDHLSRETGLFWEELAKNEVPGLDIARSRLSGYGLAKCRNLMTYMAVNYDGGSFGKFVFVDADMKPNTAMLQRLCSHNVPAVSAMYPKKRVDRLEWVGNFVGKAARPDGLVEVLDFGGGFVCLDLNAVDELIRVTDAETNFISEDDPFKDKRMHDLWSNGVVEDEWKGRRLRRYLTEDFYLSWRFRKQLGTAIYMDTLCQVGHVGTVDFLEVHSRLKELERSSIYGAPSGG